MALLCTESEHLFKLAPNALRFCHTVDSFDVHVRMLEYSRLLVVNGREVEPSELDVTIWTRVAGWLGSEGLAQAPSASSAP